MELASHIWNGMKRKWKLQKNWNIMDTKKILFRIESAKIEQFARFEENYNPAEEEIRINNKINFNFDSKTIKCLIVVTGSQNEQPIFKIVMGMNFILSPETWENLTEGNKTTIPQGFLSYMAQTCYGCIRGALLSKLENTGIDVLLPATDFSQIIKDDIELEPDKPEKQ